MSIFLLGFRNGLVCVDLNFTIFFLRRALNFLRFVLKARGSVFFFVTNWAPLQKYFKAKFSTRLHFWYSGPFLGGLLSNLKSTRYSSKARFFGNFFKTRILIPEVAILFDSATFFYIYRDAFLLGIPSIGFVDTDLDYQNILYPIILNNSGVKINFLYSVFFLNILKQEQFLERFFLVESIPAGWLQKKQQKVVSHKSNHLFVFFLRRFLTGSSFDLHRLHEIDFLRFSKYFKRVRSFVRRLLFKRIRKFQRSRLFLQRRARRLKKFIKNKHFLFDSGSLVGLKARKVLADSEVERQDSDGEFVLRRLRKRRVQFFFVKAKLVFLRSNFSRLVKVRNSNFKKTLLLLRSYRQYLLTPVLSKRSFFRRLVRKLQLSNQFITKLRKFGNLHKIFQILNMYFLKKDGMFLRHLRYVSNRILTLLVSSRRKTTMMISRLGKSFAFNQAILVKDSIKKKRASKKDSRRPLRTKVIRKVKLKGGFLLVKRRLFPKTKAAGLDFSGELGIKALRRLRLRHVRSIIEAKKEYYDSRRALYEYNNLLNSRFKTERSMFKNLSGLIRKGLFKKSQSNDRHILKKMKKPYVMYSEINPKIVNS
jgi:ribosomal protein S2